MSKYTPVPVAAARQIADEFDKSVVIIFAIDAQHDRSHMTTYGRTAEQKAWSAHLGDEVARIISGSEKREVYEDYRSIDAAKNAAKLEHVRAYAKHLDNEIGLDVIAHHLMKILDPPAEATRQCTHCGFEDSLTFWDDMNPAENPALVCPRCRRPQGASE